MAFITMVMLDMYDCKNDRHMIIDMTTWHDGHTIIYMTHGLYIA
jgi:hypothetical protein